MKHYCKYCGYETELKIHYDRHLLTKKHQRNVQKQSNKVVIDDMSGNIMLKVVKNQEELAKQNEELKQKIEHLEKVNNQNTNKIVREAREVKKSILTVLNTKFKDTPALDYIKEEYKCKLDPDD